MNKRIKELRSYLQLSQKKFGNAIGFSASAINDIEHGNCAITERLIISICAKLNVNETWLRSRNRRNVY